MDIELLIEHIKTGDTGILELVYGNPLDAISTSLRSMIIAAENKVFRVADFSSIEARGVMWLAGQQDAIKSFRDYDKGIGPDIYCVMAQHLYDRPIDKEKDPEERQLGRGGIGFWIRRLTIVAFRLTRRLWLPPLRYVTRCSND